MDTTHAEETVSTELTPIWETIETLMSHDDREGLASLLSAVPASDRVHAVFHLSEEDQAALLRMLPAELAADLIEDVPDSHAAELIDALPVREAAEIVSELPSHEQADLLSELDDEDCEAILQCMDAEDAADARDLIGYDSDVAGGLMMKEFVSFPAITLISTVLAELTSHDDDYALYNAQYTYVLSTKTNRLLGVVRLRDLIMAADGATLRDVARKAEWVSVDTPVEDLAERFQATEMRTLPVVNKRRFLLGVVRRDQVNNALAERAEQDHLKSQGIISGEELRSMPVRIRAKHRLSWLTVNIGLNMLAASVIAAFEGTLESVIALAVFLPIVSDMSGCSGNQAVAVSMRELTLGIVKPADALRVWGKEAAVGALNGLALGVLLGAAAWAWKGNPYLGLVVGGALTLNTLIAVSLGGTIPLALKRFGVDPAVASGPVLTTVTDTCGFLLVLGFATLALPLL